MKINLENTNWNYPTPIRFGIDRVKELSLFIDELKISNPLIVTDPQFREVAQFKGIIAVSYTHLTLPTMFEV